MQKLEQKFIKEMEDKDDELEAIQKALAGAGTLTSASEQLARVRDGLAPSPAMPASPAPSDMTAKLCARLTDQVKRLEEAMDTTAGEQQSLTERVRESASAIRRLQASVEQLDVPIAHHRWAHRRRRGLRIGGAGAWPQAQGAAVGRTGQHQRC